MLRRVTSFKKYWVHEQVKQVNSEKQFAWNEQQFHCQLPSPHKVLVNQQLPKYLI